MVATIMPGSELELEAESFLASHCQITHILPPLWEAVMFEVRMGLQAWTKRDVARRYLEYLRDHVNSSRLAR